MLRGSAWKGSRFVRWTVETRTSSSERLICPHDDARKARQRGSHCLARPAFPALRRRYRAGQRLLSRGRPGHPRETPVELAPFPPRPELSATALRQQLTTDQQPLEILSRAVHG